MSAVNNYHFHIYPSPTPDGENEQVTLDKIAKVVEATKTTEAFSSAEAPSVPRALSAKVLNPATGEESIAPSESPDKPFYSDDEDKFETEIAQSIDRLKKPSIYNKISLSPQNISTSRRILPIVIPVAFGVGVMLAAYYAQETLTENASEILAGTANLTTQALSSVAAAVNNTALVSLEIGKGVLQVASKLPEQSAQTISAIADTTTAVHGIVRDSPPFLLSLLPFVIAWKIW